MSFKSLLFLVSCGFFALACELVPASNAYDPDSPKEVQARATLRGRLVLEGPEDAAVRTRAIESIRIGLLDANGRRVSREGVPLARPLIDIRPDDKEGRASGGFVIEDLEAGQYTILIDGLSDLYTRPPSPLLSLAPGLVLDVGEMVFLYDGGNPGRIEGDIGAEGAALSQHHVTLYRQQDGRIEEAGRTVTDGPFAFSSLPLGNYAVVVESNGYAPAYRLDVKLDDSDASKLHYSFSGESQITLAPVTAVLLPTPAPETVVDEGFVYTRASQMGLAVFSIGREKVGVTRMRLSTTPDLLDENGENLPFVPYEAATQVVLPDREGPITIYAQFKAVSEADAGSAQINDENDESVRGFEFVSPVFTLDVIRDVTPPEVIASRIAGAEVDENGRFLSADDSLLVQIDAVDVVSAVDAVGVSMGVNPPTVLEDRTGPSGRVLLDEELIASNDGEYTVWIVLEDRAGNRSDAASLPVLVDSTAPDVSLRLANEVGGVLATRLAQIEFDETGTTTDLPVAMQVRVVGNPYSEMLPYGAVEWLIPPTIGGDGDNIVLEAKLYDLVGNTVVLSREVTLQLRGSMVGTILPEGVPLITPDASGALITLLNEQDETLLETTSGSDGQFGFENIIEGTGYQITVEWPGYRSARLQNIAITAPTVDATPIVTRLGDIPLTMLRGDVSGRVRLSDQLQDDAAHAGIVVSLRLDGPDSRSFTAATVTDAAGDFVFRELPVTRTDETMRLEARRQDYGVVNFETSVAPNTLTLVDPQRLTRNRGDFDVCPPQGECVPVVYFNTESLRIRLRDPSGVRNLWVRLNDASPVVLPWSTDNLTLLSVSEIADGEVQISLQLEKDDDSMSAPLTATVVKDTRPPAIVHLEVLSDGVALDPRFTKRVFMDVQMDADAGAGQVAPLASPRFSVQDAQPTTLPTANEGCSTVTSCRVRLPGAELDAVEEKRHIFWAYACDLAGNCSEPTAGSVTYDRTAPQGGHGAGFRLWSDGSYLDESAGEAVTVLPSYAYGAEISLGGAQTESGAQVLDETDALVADVFGFRFALSEAGLARAAWQTFSEMPAANDVRSGGDIVLPALPTGPATRRVYAQWIDAAGNPSAIVDALVRVDNQPPEVILSLNGGKPSGSVDIPFDVSVPVGAEAPYELEFRVHDGVPQRFSLPLVGTERVWLSEDETGAEDGEYRVKLKARDRAGNTTLIERSILLDRHGPRIEEVRCAGITCQQTASGLLTRNEDARIQIRVDARDSLTQVQSYQIQTGDVATVTLSAAPTLEFAVQANQTQQVQITPYDIVGNPGDAFSFMVTHDGIAPAITDLLLDQGRAFTRDDQIQVRVVVADGDAVLARFATSESFSGPYSAFASETFYALSGEDGEKQVCVQVLDQAGNASFRCESITLDREAPSGDISLPNGQQAGGTSLEIELSYTNDTAEIASSTDALDCETAQGAYRPTTQSPQRVSVDIRPVEGPQMIFACFKDQAGNVASASSVVYVDLSPPSASLSIDNGAAYTRDADVSVAVTSGERVARSAWGINDNLDCEDANYETHVSPRTLGLNFGDGLYTIHVCVEDAVGNRSKTPAVARITFDSVAPSIASFQLENGAPSTSKTQISTDTAVPSNDAVEARFANGINFSGAFVPFRENELLTLTGADGEKQICVQVRDVAGNEASACDEILLDRTAPTGSVSLPGGNVTAARTMSVELSYPAADTSAVAVSLDALPCGSSTVSYVPATGSPQLLELQTDNGEGSRTVYACFKDSAGNVSAASVPFVIDRTAPEISLTLDGGEPFTLDEEVQATLMASADAKGMAFAVDGDLNCATASYQPYIASTTLTLPRFDGWHRVSVCVEDAVGNRSAAAATAGITLDLSPPSGTIELDGGSAYTNDLEVGVVLTRSDVGVTEMALFEGAVDCTQVGAYTAFQTGNTFRISDAQGEVSVTACLRDLAGRISALTDSIVYDSMPPTGTLVLRGGENTTALQTVSAELVFSADVVGMMLSPTPISCDSAVFDVPTTQQTVQLANVGLNTVTACLKDAAGNIGVLTDQIFYENAGDGSLVVELNGGAPTTRTRNVTLGIYRPSIDFTKIKWAESPTLDCTDLTQYNDFNFDGAPPSFQLSAGEAPAEGNRTVSVCVWNGNYADPDTQFANDSIFLDTFPPNGGVVVDGGKAVTQATAVTLSLTNDYSSVGEVVSVALSNTSSLVGGQCTGSFEAFQSTKTYPVSGVDGEKTFYVCLRDVAGNTREISDSIVLDRSAPSPVSLQVAPLVRSTAVQATLSFPSETEKVAIAEGALDCKSTPLYQDPPAGNPARVDIVLSAVDGAHTLVACFRDAAGNVSQATAGTTLDRSPPTGSVVLNDGEAFTTSRNITVTLQGGADAVQMARIESAETPDCTTQTYEALVSQAPFTLGSTGDGKKTVHVCLQDAAGNTGLAIPGSIWLDESSPNGLLAIQDGQPATRVRDVLLQIDSQGNTDVTSYAVAEGNIACNATNLLYSPFAETVSFYLSANDGEKTLYLCLQDEAGNVSDVAATATITLDTTAPTLVSDALQVQDEDGYLQTETAVDVRFAWNDAGDVRAVKLAEETIDCAAASGYVDVSISAATYTWTSFVISAGAGTKRLLGCFRDAAGNTSLASDTSVRDSEAPSGTVSLNEGATYATAASGALHGFLRASPDVVRYAWQETSETNATCSQASIDCSTQTYELFDGQLIAGQKSRELNLSLAGAPPTEGKKCIEVCFEDAAGNQSLAPAFDSIWFDAQAPAFEFSLRRKSADALDSTLESEVTPERDVELVFATIDSDAVAIAVSEGALSCTQASFETLPSPLPAALIRTFTLASGSDGLRTVSVCLRDAAGNLSGALGVARTIALDTTPPDVEVSFNSGAVYATQLGVKANLAVTPASDLLARALLEDSTDSCDGALYQTDFVVQPLELDIIFSAGEGERRQAFCFRDKAGNTAKVSDAIWMDTNPPTAQLVVNGGGAYTTSTSVTLTWSDVDSDVTEMKISLDEMLDCATQTGYSAYVPSLPLELRSEQGAHTLYACVKDKAGNVSDVLSASITLDTIDPQIEFSIDSASDGATNGFTPVRSVVLDVASLSADVTSFAFAEGAQDCGTASYRDRTDGILPLVLASGSDGTRTVSFCVKDAAGRTNGATGTTRTIELDTTPPQVSLQINGGAVYATQTAATVSFASIPSNDALSRLELSDASADCVLADLPTTFAVQTGSQDVTLPSADGPQKIAFCFRDAAGNLTKSVGGILLDTDAPSGTLLLNDGASFTTSRNLDVKVGNLSSDATEIALSQETVADCATLASYGLVATNSTFQLTGVDGVYTVTACLRDHAGNVSQPFSAQIQLDTADPTVSFDVVSTNENSSPSYTNTRSVTLQILDVALDTQSIAYGEGILDCASASYQSYNEQNLSFSLASGSDGTRTVSVCVKDVSGRTNGTTGTSRTIELDTQPPEVTMEIAGGLAITNDATDVVVDVASSPVNDVLRYKISSICASDADWSDFGTLPAELSVDFRALSGTKTVSLCVQDQAGNGSQFSDSIELDVDAPSMGGFSCADCNVVGEDAWYTKESLVQLLPDIYSVDVERAWTVLYEPPASENLAKRFCESDGECRANIERCTEGLIPNQGVCAQAHTDPQNIFVDLWTTTHDDFSGLNSSGEGEQAILLYLQDLAGNVSHHLPTSDDVLTGRRNHSLWRDITPPELSFSLPDFSKTQVVFVSAIDVTEAPDRSSTPYANHGVGMLLASSLSTYADVNAIAFTPTLANGGLPVTLTAGDGQKNVYVKLTDWAGNAGTGQKTIALDTTPPTAPRFANTSAILGNDNGTRRTVQLEALALASVDVNLMSDQSYLLRGIRTRDCGTLTGGTRVTTYEFIDSGDDACSWDGTTPVTLSAAVFPNLRTDATTSDGEHRLQVSARDRAGNESARDVIQILIDTQAPSRPTLRDVNERDGSVTFVWSRDAAADIAGYLLYYGEDDNSYETADFANEGASPIFIPQPLTGTDVQFTLSGLTNDSPFLFQIKSVDVADNLSVAHCQNANRQNIPSIRREAMPNPIAPEWIGSANDIVIFDNTFGGSLDFHFDVEGPRAALMSVPHGANPSDGMALCLYDIATPASLNRLGCSRDVTPNNSVVMRGRWAYTMGDAGLQVADISDPSDIGLLQPIELNQPPNEVEEARVDHLVFVGRYAIAARGREILSLVQAGTGGALTNHRDPFVIYPVANVGRSDLTWSLSGATSTDTSPQAVRVRYRAHGAMETWDGDMVWSGTNLSPTGVNLTQQNTFGSGPPLNSSAGVVEFVNSALRFEVTALAASTRFVAAATYAKHPAGTQRRLFIYGYDPGTGELTMPVQTDVDGLGGLALESDVHDIIVENRYDAAVDKAATVITCGADGVALHEVRWTDATTDALPTMEVVTRSTIGISCGNLALSGSTLVVSQRDRYDETFVFFYDVSDLSRPTPQGRILGTKLRGSVSSLSIDGGMLYALANVTGSANVANPQKEFHAFQLTEPERMSLEGRTGGYTESFSGVVMDGALAYVAGFGKAFAVDVSQPSVPQQFPAAVSKPSRLRSDYATLDRVGRTPLLAFMETDYPFISFDAYDDLEVMERAENVDQNQPLWPCRKVSNLKTSSLRVWGGLVVVTTRTNNGSEDDRVEVWDFASNNPGLRCVAAMEISDDDYLEEISDIVDGRFYVNSGNGKVHGFRLDSSAAVVGRLILEENNKALQAGTLTLTIDDIDYDVTIAGTPSIGDIYNAVESDESLAGLVRPQLGSDPVTRLPLLVIDRTEAGHRSATTSGAFAARYSDASSLNITLSQVPANKGELGASLVHTGSSSSFASISNESLFAGSLIHLGSKLYVSRMDEYVESNGQWTVGTQGGVFVLDVANPLASTFLTPDFARLGSFGAMAWVGGQQFVVANMQGYSDPRWAAGIFGVDFTQDPVQTSRNQGLRAPRSSVMQGMHLYSVNVGSGLQVISLSR